MRHEFSVSGRLVRFETPDGFLLNGFVFPKKGSKKVVLHVPGMMSNFYDDRMFPDIARELNKAGWSFLPFNNRGHDTISDIPHVSGKWKPGGTAFEKFEGCLKDIKAAVDFAWRSGYRKIVLCGHSTGCQKITYYQSKTGDRRVKGLILLGPVDDYNSIQKEFGKKVFRKLIRMSKKSRSNKILLPKSLTKSYWFSPRRFLSAHDLSNPEARIFNYESEMKIFRKVKLPILAVFGSRDEFRVKPVEENFRIMRRNTESKSLECVSIEGANHSFIGKSRELAKNVADWVKKV